ncbi:MAG: hypothetical protein ABMA15_12305 [Vicinamibacterales bacterium]
MKILFSAMHFAYFRNFESVIRGLAERGHRVHLAADEPESFGGQALAERLTAEYPAVSWSYAPQPAAEPSFVFARRVRHALDYVRFLDPRYADVPKLRLRNVERAPRIVRWLTSGVGGGLGGHRLVGRLLRWIERSMPPSAAARTFLETQSPDAVVLTSLTFSRSSAIEQLKSARAFGIPVAAGIMSWDHLSSKALLHIAPDLTLVWNDVQKREATEMHALPADRVVVTGAQCYDQWFDRRPSRSREEFCRRAGLDPKRSFVLYVCSAMSPVPDPIEPRFVKEWVLALRSSDDPVLRDAGVLVRPHPERVKEWAGISLDGLDNVVVHGATPIDRDSKADYFDALVFSRAVVGLCTSAFLEAAIVGRPVLTLMLPPYRMHQDGMAHFRYLLNVEGGLLHTAPDLAAHLRQLAEALSAPETREERNRQFLTAFIRPGGLDTPATPAFVEAIERLAATPRRSEREATPAVAATAWVRWLATAAATRPGQWLMMDGVDIARAESERQRGQVKEQILDARAAYHDHKAMARDEQRRASEQRRRAKSWTKWRRGLSARKQVARLKGGLKQLTGARHQ